MIGGMRHAVAARFACALAVATMLLTRHTSASEPDVSLDYEAPAACPTKASFVEDVRARLAGRPVGARDERRFRVRIAEGEGASFHGALETVDPPSVRDVEGETCDEVVRALVVFVALALTPTDAEPPVGDRRPADAPRERPRPPPTTRDGTPAVTPAAPPPRPPFIGADLRAIAGAGVMPGIAPGGALAGRLVLQTHPSFRWVVHAGGVAAYREKAVLNGAFDFLWYAARIDAGPAVDLGGFRLSAGPVVRAGVLSVRARNLPAAGKYSSFWGDVGGFARVDRRIAPTVALSLMVEAAVPLERRTFGIERIDQPVHEIAPVIGVLSFGLALGR